ncbi:MAG: YebC/PmpR family DNA-binding transcriptional regulator [Acidobacteriota bacterium]
MAGHSKWANIKHRKGAQDARRAKIFTKIAREILVAAREGGGDPAANPRLRSAIAAARAANMPNERIEKAIAKGTGEAGAEAYEEVTYEGYGPGGVAILVTVLTDNRNRTGSEIRNIFSKAGGQLGEPNSVAWMFDRKGLIAVPRDAIDEDRLLEIVLEAGGEDVETGDEYYEISTAPEEFAAVRDALEQAGVAMQAAEIALVPKTTVAVDPAKAESVVALLEKLDDHDDVQKVAANCVLPEDVASA